MKCLEAQHRWHRRLDKGKSDAELDVHLASCASCRKYAAAMARLIGLFDELREDTESLTPTATQTGPQAAPRSRREWSSSGARSVLRIAAAVLLTVSAALWYGKERTGSVLEQSIINAIPTMGITLRAQSREQFMAVAAPSHEPNVQTYWLYPMVTVAEGPHGPQNQ